LTDLVCSNSVATSNYECSTSGNHTEVFLNNGDGTWTDVSSTWTFPHKVSPSSEFETFIAGTPGQDTGLRIVDINGDNLPDLVRSSNGQRYTYLNTGSGWTH